MNIQDIIPEINLIEDPDIRSKVISVWEAAIERGGWQIAELTEIPFTLLIKECQINIITHTRGVTTVAIDAYSRFIEFYGEKIKLNKDLLIAGAILHDVGKLLEYVKGNGCFRISQMGSYLRHAFIGMNLCAEHGLPCEVQHIVATHSKEGETIKRSNESILVHHADFMNFEPFKP